MARRKNNKTPDYLRYLDSLSEEELDRQASLAEQALAPRPEATPPVLPSATPPVADSGVGGFLRNAASTVAQGGRIVLPGIAAIADALGTDIGQNAIFTAMGTQAAARAASARTEMDDASLFGMSGPGRMSSEYGVAQTPLTPEEEAERQARLEQDLASARADQEVAQAQTASLEARMGGRMAPGSFASRAVGTVLGQPEQALSVVGGIAGGAVGGPVGAGVGAALGSVPMANLAHNAAYAEAVDEFGATPEDAKAYALIMTGIEFGMESVGGLTGGAIAQGARRLGLTSFTKQAAREALARKVRGPIAGTIGAGIVGGIEEGLTEVAQDAANRAMEEGEFFSTDEAREALKLHNAEQAATSLERFLDATAAGVVGGTGMGGGGVTLTTAAARGEQEAITAQRTLENFFAANSRIQADIMAEESLQKAVDREFIFDVRDSIQAEDAEAARSRAEEDMARLYDPQRIADEQEAGFREMERQRQAEELSRLGTVTDTRPAITPESVAAERQAEQQRQEQEQATAEQARRRREAEIAQANREAEVRKERQALQKQQRREQKKQETAQRTQRRELHRQVLQENPELSDAEVASIVDERLAQPQATSLEQEVGVVTARKEAAKKAAETRARRSRISALRRANPTATNAEIAAMLKPEQQADGTTAPVTPQQVREASRPQPQPTETQASVIDTPGKSPMKAELAAHAEAMGINLGMAQNELGADKQNDPSSYVAKVADIIRGLVLMNNNDSVAVQNLLRQGKIIIAPNAESVNQDATTNVAEFSPETGEMFIYTDRMTDGQNAAGVVIKAVHESAHFGQLTPREGRRATLRSIFGDDAHVAIRAAAEQGNEDARRAVEQAASVARGNTVVENLEIPAYFLGNVQESGSTPRGRVRNFIPNIIGRTRNLLRDRLGVDLDVTAEDIAAATTAVLEEAVATDIQPQGSGFDLENLAMIAGPSATGFARAQQRGETYIGARDFRERFEIPDDNAELFDGVESMDSDAQSGMAVRATLDNVLEHDALYENYPDLRNYALEVRDLSGTAYGYHDYDNRRIVVDKDLLHLAAVIPEAPSMAPEANGGTNAEFLRRTLLHEVQHAIQSQEGFVPGTNMYSFIPREAIDALSTAKRAYNEVVKNFDLGRAEQSLTPQVKSVWNNEVRAYDAVSHDKKAELFLSQGYFDDSTDRMIKGYGPRYRAAAETLADAHAAYKEARQRAYQVYLRDYGETEARNTEFRSRMAPEELAAQAPESTMEQAHGNIPVERTLDTTPLTGHNLPAESAIAPTEVQPAENLAETLYRDTDAEGVIRIWEKMSRTEALGAANTVYATNDPELALGQLGSSGIMIELDPTGFEANADMSKPAAPVLAQQGQYELVIRPKRNTNSHDFIKSLTMQPGWVRRNGDYGDRLALRIRQEGWEKTQNDDGSVSFRPPAQPRTLGMASNEAADTIIAPFTRRSSVPSWLRGLVDSSQGAGRVANAIVEHARSSPAEGRMLAEGYLARYDDAVNSLAAERGVTSAELGQEIADKIDSIDKASDSYEQNKTAFIEAVRPYDKAGEALINLREQIDDLTLDIIRQRAVEAEGGNPLTDAEKETYRTLMNNMGRYAHRQYAVNTGRPGQKYARTVWNDYEKAKTKKRTNPGMLNNYKTVADAVTYLVNNNLVIPDDAALAKLSNDRTRDLYDVWGSVGDPAGLSIEAMKEELAGKRDAINGDTDRLNRVAESIVQELLGLASPTSSITRHYRGGKRDDTILKERTNISQELRTLMGEITDPGTRLMITAAKQTEFVARNRMLLELRNQVGEHIQPPDAEGTPAAEGMQALDGEAWGPLQGYLVSDNMRNLIGDTVQQLATFEQSVAMAATNPGQLTEAGLRAAINMWGTVAGTSKALQIVGNPMNFVYNWVGAPRMMLSNGNLNPKNFARAHKTSMALIASAMSPAAATQDAIDANKYGVTDSAFIGELKSAEYRKVAEAVRKMSGRNPSATWATLRTLGVGAKELYAMMDVWSKLANFYHQIDTLSAFYKAEGIPKTKDEIYREAADNTNRTNITYKRAAPLVKALERGGITQFGTYFYETFRVEVANVLQGIDELKRAQSATTREGANIMRLQAAKRLGGQMTAWGLTYALAKSLSELAFGDDEEERRNKRLLLPEFLRDQDFYPVGKDENGNVVLFNVARFDPIGPNADIMRAIMHEGASAETVMGNIVELYIAPRVGTQLLKALETMVTDAAPTRQPVVQQRLPEPYSYVMQISPMEDRQTKAWTNVVEAFLPGIVTAYRDTNVRPVREDALSTVTNITTYMGGTLYSLNPQAAARSAGFEYNDTLKNARRDAKDMFLDHPGTLSENQILSRLVDLRQREKDAFIKVNNTYKGMVANGMNRREAIATLKTMRVPQEVLDGISNRRFQSRLISQDSIKAYAQSEINMARSRAEKAEIRKKWNDVWQTLSGAQRSLENRE